MTQTESASPYAVRLDDLERETRVPLEAQVAEQSAIGALDPNAAWIERQRQLRLSGAA